jgi:hypothetical protein
MIFLLIASILFEAASMLLGLYFPGLISIVCVFCFMSGMLFAWTVSRLNRLIDR